MATKQQATPAQPRNINQIVKYLTNTFNTVTSKLDKAVWHQTTGPNEAYILQSEFAYLLNEVMMCAPCMIQKNIGACNDYIDRLIQKQQSKK